MGDWVASGEPPEHDRVIALFDAHVDEVYRYVHRRCLDHSIAEDITQDVFVAALATGPDELSVGWLMRSARNRMIDILRRETSLRDKIRLLVRDADDHIEDVGAVVEHLAMRDALGRLRPEHRIVLMLHYVDDASVAELAAAIGRSYKGAEGLLSRARVALRTELETVR